MVVSVRSSKVEASVTGVGADATPSAKEGVVEATAASGGGIDAVVAAGAVVSTAATSGVVAGAGVASVLGPRDHRESVRVEESEPATTVVRTRPGVFPVGLSPDHDVLAMREVVPNCRPLENLEVCSCQGGSQKIN